MASLIGLIQSALVPNPGQRSMQQVSSLGILGFDSAAEGDQARPQKHGGGGKMATGDDSPSST